MSFSFFGYHQKNSIAHPLQLHHFKDDMHCIYLYKSYFMFFTIQYLQRRKLFMLFITNTLPIEQENSAKKAEHIFIRYMLQFIHILVRKYCRITGCEIYVLLAPVLTLPGIYRFTFYKTLQYSTSIYNTYVIFNKYPCFPCYVLRWNSQNSL